MEGRLNISYVAFTIIFGGTVLGMALPFALPEPHLSADNKDVTRLSTGVLCNALAPLGS